MGSPTSPLRKHRFAILLAALFALLASTAITPLLRPISHPMATRILAAAILAALVLAGVNAVCETRRLTRIALALAVPSVLLDAVSVAEVDPGVLIVNHALSIAFFGFAMVVIVRFLFRSKRVTFDLICASLCVYLLLAIVWAHVYSVVVAAQPGAFLLPDSSGAALQDIRPGGDFGGVSMYFSLVTLTTLGYGDIIPLSSSARILASLEAVIGQIYLVVLVARLVGLHIAQTTQDRKRDGDGSQQ